MGKTKRKRSRSRDATATSPIFPSNPFLFPQGRDNDDQNDALLDNLMIFKSRGGKLKSSGDDTNDSMEDVTYLVEYLVSVTTQSTTFARTDVALLLLPWSLQQLQQQNATAGIIWKSLSVSLSILVNDGSLSTVAFQKILSQSVLFKLVPKVAAMAAAAAATSDGNEHDTTNACQHPVVMYKMLLDMFRPAMEVACKAVLLPLVDKIRTSASLSAQQHSVFLETLRWIQSIHLSRKGNPKTTFQLLADQSVLVAFSRCHLLLQGEGRIVVREILCGGLFHSRYHIEGFAALLLKEAVVSSSKSNDVSKSSSKPLSSNDSHFTNTKASAFKSYHEELLETIAAALSQVGNADVVVIVRIIPVLLRGFFVQSVEWDRQERVTGSKGKKSAIGKKADTLFTIQFQLFVWWARFLLIQFLSTDASAVALQSLRQMLELVLEFDAYTPSQQGTNGDEQYSFLQSVTAQIFTFPTQEDSVKREQLIPDSIRCLRLLFQLHHLLIHDKIVEALSLCLQGCDEALFSLISDFLTTVVETYRLLRQQRYIFASMLKTVRRSIEVKALDEISFLLALLMDPKLASSIAVAVESSPSLEVKEVFRTISDWIVDLCKSALGDDATNTEKSMDVAVQLSTIATRNVRVDRGTAADVAIACQDFVNVAIRILVENGISQHESTSAALTLSGLVLDLHTRCIFWLGRNEKLDIPSHISDTLKSAVMISTSSNSRLPDGVIFLACHRLKQLHSLIYDLEREEMEHSSSEGKSYVLTAEATHLAAYIANEVEPCKGSPLRRGHRWVAVAQNFSSWISYAHRHLIDQFLRWVVSASAQSVAGTLISLPLSTLGKIEHSAASLGNDYSAHSREQAETAKCLLADASFFQHVDVSSRISLVGYSVAADCISLALSFSSTNSVELRRLVSTPLKEATWRRSSHSELLQLVKGCSKIDLVTRAEVIPLLKSALSSVLIVNGIQRYRYVSSEVDALDTIDLALRTDHACRSLCLSHHDLLPIGISIVSALRLSLVKMVGGTHAQAVHSFLCTSGHIGDLVCGMMISATCLLVKHDLPDSIESEQLISATGQLVERLLAGASSSPLDYITAKILSTTFSAVRIASRSTIESHALISISRRLLQGLHFSEWHTLYPSEGDKVTKHLAAVYGTVWDLVMTSDNPAPSDIREVLAPQILIGADSFTDGLLLLADLVCAKYVAWLPDTTLLMDEMQRSCIECLGRAQNESTSESSWNTVCYLSGRLTLCRPTEKLTDSIVDSLVSIKAVPHDTTLLETSFCHATPCLHGDDLQKVIVKLTESVEHDELPSSVGARLRLITLLIRYLKEDDQIRLLSSYGRLILTIALKPMLGRTGEPFWFGNVVAASSLVEDLLKRRDILSLKERDLALIMSYTIGVLGPAENASNTEKHTVANCAGDDTTAVYICLADLLSTMFQRYTKQLYACVPSVISALYCFLRHVMCSQLLLSDHSVAVRGQHFTRLCEHMVGHREIYKKHVVGLVLEFVVGLGQTMSFQRRDSLLPAIYCLLDTMSTFETQQLNAYMDGKAKIQFRTIHQSYQKLHAYKGQ